MTSSASVSQATLDKAVAGDPAAIGLLWRAWNAPLLRFLRSRKVLDHDDLASTIWIDIAAKLPTFVGDPKAFRRWLFTVAHRRIIDKARAANRQPRTTPLGDSTAPTGTNAFSVAGSAEWAISLLQQLPEDQATAIALRILADLPVLDVSVVMGISEGNVRVLTHRGLATLRERLIRTDTGHADDPTTPRIDPDVVKNTENVSNVVTLEAFRSLTPDT